MRVSRSVALARPNLSSRSRRGLLPATALVLLLPAAAGAEQLWLLSKGIAGDAPAGGATPLRLSADGRYLLMESSSSGWQPGLVDLNAGPDLYLWDRLAGTYALVSHAAGATLTTANAPVDANVRQLSPDGRYVAFSSFATNLIAGGTDANGETDTFLWDRDTGTVTLVSHAFGSSVDTAAGFSVPESMSADGRYVAISSSATNLVAGQGGCLACGGVFLWDRDTGAITLVSRALASATAVANAVSSGSRISADGEYVAFSSYATNLVVGTDTNNAWDSFLWNRASGTITLVSHAFDSPSTAAHAALGLPDSVVLAVSEDGRYVTLDSFAYDLVDVQGGCFVGCEEAYQWDRETDQMKVVSHVQGSPLVAGNDQASPQAASADGGFVAIRSQSSNYLSGGSDTNGNLDAFLWDRENDDSLALASHASSSATTAGNGITFTEAISGDGRLVGFQSSATNLVTGGTDTNDASDAYVWDRTTGDVTLVSHAFGNPSTASEAGGSVRAISGDGSWVAFVSSSEDLIAPGSDTNGIADAYLWSESTGASELASHTSVVGLRGGGGTSAPQAISTDGTYVAFTSSAQNLIPGGNDNGPSDDAFLWNRSTQTLTLASHASGSLTTPGNDFSQVRGMSADGRFVTFRSHASDLIDAGVDANASSDAFVWDRNDGVVSLVSHGPAAPTTPTPGMSEPVAISADGRYVAFQSTSTSLIAGGTDTNASLDAFLWDRVGGAVTLVSHAAGAPTTSGSKVSEPVAISADGRYVAFESGATNLITGGSDTNFSTDSFLWDRTSGIVTLVSHAAGAPTTTADGSSDIRAMSSDGRYVAFVAGATNLLVGGSGCLGCNQVYLWDRDTGAVTLVSHVPGSATIATADGSSIPRAISSDGRFLVFSSTAVDLAPGADTNGGRDVYLWDRTTGLVTLASHTPASTTTAGNNISEPQGISADGQYVVFSSSATNLVGGTDTNNRDDAFRWSRATGAVTLISHAVGNPATTGTAVSIPGPISADGTYVALSSAADNLVAGDFNGFPQAFLWAGEITLLSDGLETGDTCRWDAPVGGPACP